MYKSKMMIVMRRDLKMRKGKIAAQAGHACVDAILMALNKEGRMNDVEVTAEGFDLRTTDKPISPLSDWFLYGCAIPMLQKGNSQKDHKILWSFCYSKAVFLNILCLAVQKSLALI